jgi:uncharacterized protein (TIRG00374 family)
MVFIVMAEEKKRAQRWKVIINTFTFAALALLFYLVWDDIVETFQRLDDVNLWILLLIIPAQAINFLAYSKMYQYLLTFLGHTLKLKTLYRITLELNFVNHVFPSGGVSGFSYFSLRMKPLKVSTSQSTLIQVMRFVLIFVSFQALLVFGLLALTLSGSVNNFVLLLSGSLATLLLVGTLLTGYIVGSKRRINSFFTGATKFINKIIGYVRPNNKETISVARVEKGFTELHENYVLFRKDFGVLGRPLWQALVANATEIITLYAVFAAFGFWVNPGAVILAYAVANFAGLVAVLPGGVGIYEALMATVLASAGIPVSVSIPVIIMYRVLTIVLQLPLGYYLYNRAVQDNDITL